MLACVSQLEVAVEVELHYDETGMKDRDGKEADKE